MKVLITGTTSQQVSQNVALRIPTFASLLAKVYLDAGAFVDFEKPSYEMDIDTLANYDVVVVGIAPPTSLSANKIYPAFALANKARKIGNLVLFVDAPEPYKIQASLKSCHLNLSDLRKDFYSKRANYKEFVEDKTFSAEVDEFIEYLYTEEWPPTIYPSFPWADDEIMTQSLPNLREDLTIGLNLDAGILETNHLGSGFDYAKDYWTCDSPNTKWALGIQKVLANPVLKTRRRPYDSQGETLNRMKRSIGTLISVYRAASPWWSPTLALSLSVGVPVVTEWRYSAPMGLEWTHLASAIEDMAEVDRYAVASAQKESYLNTIPSWSEAIQKVLDIPVFSKLSK